MVNPKTTLSARFLTDFRLIRFRYALTGYSNTEHHRNGVSRFESVWQLFNQAVILLQRFYSTFATVAILYTLNSLYSRNSPSERCDVTYLVFEAHFANCFAVFCIIALCLWRVDYKTNFLVHNTARVKARSLSSS